MADTKPIKVNFTSGNATSLGEFQTDETVPVENGGTGASDSANARNNLGLGDLATQDSNNVNMDGGSITGIDVDVSGATFTVANDQISGDAINGGTATPTALNVDSGTLFVDSANNRVGVGTSSPGSKFQIVENKNDSSTLWVRNNDSGASASAQILLDAYFNNFTITNFGGGSSSANRTDLGSTRSGSYLTFTTSGSESARIDSDGNLLVGTTADNTWTTTNEGIVLNGALSFLGIGRQGAHVAQFNRISSDGEIVRFSKDGSTVGSIGVFDGTFDYFVIGGTDTTNNSGIIFDNGRITPWNVETNSSTDAAIDLGNDGSRWKDLYLSGGVYLGGTGSANYLDDYEEGTFSPTIGGTSSNPSGANYTKQVGKYTKTGNTVHIMGEVQFSDSGTGGAGMLLIDSLPFANGVGNYIPCLVNVEKSGGPAENNFMGLVEPSTNSARVYYNNDGSGSMDSYDWIEFESNQLRFRFSITYQTN